MAIAIIFIDSKVGTIIAVFYLVPTMTEVVEEIPTRYMASE